MSLVRVGGWQQHGKGAAPSCSANSEGTGNPHLSLTLHEVSAHGLCLALLLHIGPEVPLMESLQRMKKTSRGQRSLLRSTGSGCCCEAEVQHSHNQLPEALAVHLNVHAGISPQKMRADAG